MVVKYKEIFFAHTILLKDFENRSTQMKEKSKMCCSFQIEIQKKSCEQMNCQ